MTPQDWDKIIDRIAIAAIVGMIIIIITVSVVLTNEEKKEKEKFSSTNGVGPYTPNAGPTAWFRTFGRECEPGLTKCYAGNNQYFCTKKKNCHLKAYNLKGAPVKEPMIWFMRHA